MVRFIDPVNSTSLQCISLSLICQILRFRCLFNQQQWQCGTGIGSSNGVAQAGPRTMTTPTQHSQSPIRQRQIIERRFPGAGGNDGNDDDCGTNGRKINNREAYPRDVASFAYARSRANTHSQTRTYQQTLHQHRTFRNRIINSIL